MQIGYYRRYLTWDAPSCWDKGKRTSSSHSKRGWTDQRAWLWVSLVMACVIYGVAHAQGSLGIDPSGRPRVVPPSLLPEEPLQEEPRPSPLPAPILPPLPSPPAE